MVVRFSRLRNKKVEKVGMAALYKGRIRFLGFRRAAALLATLKEGFEVGGKSFAPADGGAYLKALLRRYRGDYLRADAMEGDGGS